MTKAQKTFDKWATITVFVAALAIFIHALITYWY